MAVSRQNYQERHRRRMIQGLRDSDSSVWVACLSASRIVGNYDEGATKDFAEAMAAAIGKKLSVSQIENYAKAGVAYRFLRKFAKDLPAIRRATSMTHFGVMWELFRKYEFSPLDMVEDLRTAAENDVSVASMKIEITNREEHSETPDWELRGKTIYKKMKRLIEDPELLPPIAKVADDWIIMWERYFPPEEE